MLQVLLQTIQGSNAAGSYSEELAKWTKSLQTIETVLGVWVDFQIKWAETEEVRAVQNYQQFHKHTSAQFLKPYFFKACTI